MTWVDLEYFDIFHQESNENLSFLEELIDRIDENISQQDLDHLFRVFHSLKGIAGMMGFEHLCNANHIIENQLKAYEIGVSDADQFKNWLHFCRDVLTDMVSTIAAAVEEQQESMPDLKGYYEQVESETHSIFGGDKPAEVSDSQEDLSDFYESFDERFKNIEELINDNSVSEIKSVLHSIKGEAGVVGLPNLCDVIHYFEDLCENDFDKFSIYFSEFENIFNDAKSKKSDQIFADYLSNINSKAETSILASLPEEFLASLVKLAKSINEHVNNGGLEDQINELIKGIQTTQYYDELTDLKALVDGSLMIGWENVSENIFIKDLLLEIKRLLQESKKDAEAQPQVIEENQSTESETETIRKVEAKPEEVSDQITEKNKETKQSVKNIVAPQPKVVGQAHFKIKEGSVNSLMDLAGEFIVAKNILNHNIKLLKTQKNTSIPKELLNISATLSRLSESLQYQVMGMRLIPCKEVFRKAPKIVRDISRRLGKKIRLDLVGEETEIDKVVSDKISDALLHIIRNSCDHGIEMPEVREESGKDHEGVITLKASIEQSYLRIDILDDGGGINTARVGEKVVANGIISQEELEDLSVNDIAQFIFHPGLSTAEQVSDISGRGVGMDVVKQNVEGLGGHVELHTDPGKGSQFSLFVPLNTTVKKCLITLTDGDFIAYGIDQISETIKVGKENLIERSGSYYFPYRDNIIRILNYEEGKVKDKVHLVIFAANGAQHSIQVEKFFNYEDLVIKPTPFLMKDIPGVSGVSVLGDGSAVIVYDIPKIYNYYSTYEALENAA